MAALGVVFMLLVVGSQQAHALPSNTLSIMSYNIMDSGFKDASGIYDRVGNRVPGNLSNLMASQSPFVDVLGLVETAAWRKYDTSTHPGYLSIAKSWGYEYVHVRSNCAIMSHAPLDIIDEPSVGYDTIVARVLNTTFIVTYMSSTSYKNKYKDFEAMASYVMKYKDEPLILMGDLNAISPQDKPRYNEALLCGDGTYIEAAQTGEYVKNYCLEPTNVITQWEYDVTKGIKWCSGEDCLIDTSGQCGGEQADLFSAGFDGNCALLPRAMDFSEQVDAAKKACSGARECAGFTLYMDNKKEPGLHEACFRSDVSEKPADPTSAAHCYEKRGFKTRWRLDFYPMERLLDTSDLIDLCFVTGGFYDVDTNNRAYPTSQCGFSNPTLLIRMTGSFGDESHYSASEGYNHAMAKIDYILANSKMLDQNRFHHTNVMKMFQADGCSDHYPIEAVFMGKKDRTGQDRTGQDRTGQDRTGQDRTGQDRTRLD